MTPSSSSSSSSSNSSCKRSLEDIYPATSAEVQPAAGSDSPKIHKQAKDNHITHVAMPLLSLKEHSEESYLLDKSIIPCQNVVLENTEFKAGGDGSKRTPFQPAPLASMASLASIASMGRGLVTSPFLPVRMNRPAAENKILTSSKEALAQLSKDIAAIGYAFTADKLALICQLVEEEINKPNRSTQTKQDSSLFINIEKSKCRHSLYAALPKLQACLDLMTKRVKIHIKVAKSDTELGTSKNFSKAITLSFTHQAAPKAELHARLSAKAGYTVQVQKEALFHQQLQQALTSEATAICQLHETTPLYTGKAKTKKIVMYTDYYHGGDLFNYLSLSFDSSSWKSLSKAEQLSHWLPVMHDMAKAVHAVHQLSPHFP